MKPSAKTQPLNVRKSSRARDFIGAHVLSAQLLEPGVPRRKRHHASRWVVGIILGITVVGAAIGIGREFLRRSFYENPHYALAEISIQGDLPLPRSQLLQIADIKPGTNIFKLDLRGAYERLKALPEIESVELIRRVPNKLTITVQTRHAVAWIAPGAADDSSLAAASHLVDASGFVFPETERRPEHHTLPVIYAVPGTDIIPGSTIKSREALAALELITMLAGTRVGSRFQIVSIDLSRPYCMTVRDRSRALFLMDFENLTDQIATLETLLAYCDEHQKDIRQANLMVRKNLPVVFADTPPDSDPTIYEPVALPPEPTPPARIETEDVTQPQKQPRSEGLTTRKRNVETTKQAVTTSRSRPSPTARRLEARPRSVPANARKQMAAPTNRGRIADAGRATSTRANNSAARGAYNVPLTPWTGATKKPVRR